MVVSSIPELPLVCLKTADHDKNTREVTKGKNTVIDFWTTKCTRCPDALDKLDDMASDPKYQDVQFISICCDKLDGARNIIEASDDLRWQNVSHYFMSHQSKEEAKKVLGFKSVPFYVVLDEQGNIQQSGGGKSIDFDEIPGVVKEESVCAPIEDEEPSESSIDEFCDEFGDMDINLDFSNNATPTKPTTLTAPSPVSVTRVFDMDDFDF